MDRFFVSAEGWDEARVVLGREESHHCLRVMRKRTGDRVEIFDGAGRWGRGVIAEESDDLVAVMVGEEGRERRGSPGIGLVVAIPKGKMMDLVVQKAVELGVDQIQPLVTEHTVVRLEDGNGAGKREKWQRVALEACKQCGRNFVPEVRAVASLEEVLGERGGRAGLLASLREDAVSLKEVLGGLPAGLEGVDLLIGPEGDFSAAETESAVAGGFQLVSFGSLTLRVETAVMYGLSVLGYGLR